ncbi:MAG: transposase [Planctomycetes bacterium]|nr:transposase [Planctomycetota bacterium]
MGKRRRGRGSKYTGEFKRQLVAESRADGVSVPMVSRQHGVPTSRIYSWRGDARFQPDGSEPVAFTPVEISGVGSEEVLVLPEPQRAASSQIEITLENGRKLHVSGGADASFVLELARGLAA